MRKKIAATRAIFNQEENTSSHIILDIINRTIIKQDISSHVILDIINRTILNQDTSSHIILDIINRTILNQDISSHVILDLYINIASVSGCLYPINVKTAEPIGPKLCVEPHLTPGKVYE